MRPKFDPNGPPRKVIRCKFRDCKHRWMSQRTPPYCPKCRRRSYATGVPGRPGRKVAQPIALEPTASAA